MSSSLGTETRYIILDFMTLLSDVKYLLYEERLSQFHYCISFLLHSYPNHTDPGTEVIKLFSCSTQLSIKLKLLINDEIAQINLDFRFRSPKPVIYSAHKC